MIDQLHLRFIHVYYTDGRKKVHSHVIYLEEKQPDIFAFFNDAQNSCQCSYHHID